MTFEEYSEKNKKSQNVSEDGALDDHDLDAVAGGFGDIKLKIDVKTEVKNVKNETVNDITIKDSHRNESIVEKSVEANGDIFADGGIFF